MKVPARTKPQSVMRRSRASSTARVEGAPTATSRRAPRHGGLLDELEGEAAADAEDRVARAAAPPHRTPIPPPCPSRCGGRRPRAGTGALRRGRTVPSRAARPSARRRPGRRAAGQAAHERELAARASPLSTARRLDRDGLERALSAHAARGRRVEAPPQPLASKPGASTSTVFAARSSGSRAPTAGMPFADSRTRARAPRRGPGVRIVTATGSRPRGSRAAPRPRPGPGSEMPAGSLVTSSSDVDRGGGAGQLTPMF